MALRKKRGIGYSTGGDVEQYRSMFDKMMPPTVSAEIGEMPVGPELRPMHEVPEKQPPMDIEAAKRSEYEKAVRTEADRLFSEDGQPGFQRHFFEPDMYDVDGVPWETKMKIKREIYGIGPEEPEADERGYFGRAYDTLKGLFTYDIPEPIGSRETDETIKPPVPTSPDGLDVETVKGLPPTYAKRMKEPGDIYGPPAEEMGDYQRSKEWWDKYRYWTTQEGMGEVFGFMGQLFGSGEEKPTEDIEKDKDPTVIRIRKEAENHIARISSAPMPISDAQRQQYIERVRRDTETNIEKYMKEKEAASEPTEDIVADTIKDNIGEDEQSFLEWLKDDFITGARKTKDFATYYSAMFGTSLVHGTGRTLDNISRIPTNIGLWAGMKVNQLLGRSEEECISRANAVLENEIMVNPMRVLGLVGRPLMGVSSAEMEAWFPEEANLTESLVQMAGESVPELLLMSYSMGAMNGLIPARLMTWLSRGGNKAKFVKELIEIAKFGTYTGTTAIGPGGVEAIPVGAAHGAELGGYLSAARTMLRRRGIIPMALGTGMAFAMPDITRGADTQEVLKSFLFGTILHLTGGKRMLLNEKAKSHLRIAKKNMKRQKEGLRKAYRTGEITKEEYNKGAELYIAAEKDLNSLLENEPQQNKRYREIKRPDWLKSALSKAGIDPTVDLRELTLEDLKKYPSLRKNKKLRERIRRYAENREGGLGEPAGVEVEKKELPEDIEENFKKEEVIDAKRTTRAASLGQLEAITKDPDISETVKEVAGKELEGRIAGTAKIHARPMPSETEVKVAMELFPVFKRMPKTRLQKISKDKLYKNSIEKVVADAILAHKDLFKSPALEAADMDIETFRLLGAEVQANSLLDMKAARAKRAKLKKGSVEAVALDAHIAALEGGAPVDIQAVKEAVAKIKLDKAAAVEKRAERILIKKLKEKPVTAKKKPVKDPDAELKKTVERKARKSAIREPKPKRVYEEAEKKRVDIEDISNKDDAIEASELVRQYRDRSKESLEEILVSTEVSDLERTVARALYFEKFGDPSKVVAETIVGKKPKKATKARLKRPKGFRKGARVLITGGRNEGIEGRIVKVGAKTAQIRSLGGGPEDIVRVKLSDLKPVEVKKAEPREVAPEGIAPTIEFKEVPEAVNAAGPEFVNLWNEALRENKGTIRLRGEDIEEDGQPIIENVFGENKVGLTLSYMKPKGKRGTGELVTKTIEKQRAKFYNTLQEEIEQGLDKDEPVIVKHVGRLGDLDETVTVLKELQPDIYLVRHEDGRTGPLGIKVLEGMEKPQKRWPPTEGYWDLEDGEFLTRERADAKYLTREPAKPIIKSPIERLGEVSAEEIARPGINWAVNKVGRVTYLGKQVDLPTGAEAVFAAKPDGTLVVRQTRSGLSFKDAEERYGKKVEATVVEAAKVPAEPTEPTVYEITEAQVDSEIVEFRERAEEIFSRDVTPEPEKVLYRGKPYKALETTKDKKGRLIATIQPIRGGRKIKVPESLVTFASDTDIAEVRMKTEPEVILKENELPEKITTTKEFKEVEEAVADTEYAVEPDGVALNVAGKKAMAKHLDSDAAVRKIREDSLREYEQKVKDLDSLLRSGDLNDMAAEAVKAEIRTTEQMVKTLRRDLRGEEPAKKKKIVEKEPEVVKIKRPKLSDEAMEEFRKTERQVRASEISDIRVGKVTARPIDPHKGMIEGWEIMDHSLMSVQVVDKDHMFVIVKDSAGKVKDRVLLRRGEKLTEAGWRKYSKRGWSYSLDADYLEGTNFQATSPFRELTSHERRERRWIKIRNDMLEAEMAEAILTEQRTKNVAEKVRRSIQKGEPWYTNLPKDRIESVRDEISKIRKFRRPTERIPGSLKNALREIAEVSTIPKTERLPLSAEQLAVMYKLGWSKRDLAKVEPVEAHRLYENKVAKDKVTRELGPRVRFMKVMNTWPVALREGVWAQLIPELKAYLDLKYELGKDWRKRKSMVGKLEEARLVAEGAVNDYEIGTRNQLVTAISERMAAPKKGEAATIRKWKISQADRYIDSNIIPVYGEPKAVIVTDKAELRRIEEAKEFDAIRGREFDKGVFETSIRTLVKKARQEGRDDILIPLENVNDPTFQEFGKRITEKNGWKWDSKNQELARRIWNEETRTSEAPRVAAKGQEFADWSGEMLELQNVQPRPVPKVPPKLFTDVGIDPSRLPQIVNKNPKLFEASIPKILAKIREGGVNASRLDKIDSWLRSLADPQNYGIATVMNPRTGEVRTIPAEKLVGERAIDARAEIEGGKTVETLAKQMAITMADTDVDTLRAMADKVDTKKLGTEYLMENNVTFKKDLAGLKKLIKNKANGLPHSPREYSQVARMAADILEKKPITRFTDFFPTPAFTDWFQRDGIGLDRVFDVARKEGIPADLEYLIDYAGAKGFDIPKDLHEEMVKYYRINWLKEPPEDFVERELNRRGKTRKRKGPLKGERGSSAILNDLARSISSKIAKGKEARRTRRRSNLEIPLEEQAEALKNLAKMYEYTIASSEEVRDPMLLAFDGENAAVKWQSIIREGDLNARYLMETSDKMVKDPARRRRLYRAIENFEKWDLTKDLDSSFGFDETFDHVTRETKLVENGVHLGKMTPYEQAAARFIGERYKELLQVALEEGLVDNWCANYINHVVKGAGDWDKNRVLNEIQRAKSAATRVRGGRGRTNTSFIYSFGRIHPTTEAGIRESGIKYIEDPFLALAMYERALHTALASRALVKFWKGFEVPYTTADGRTETAPLITSAKEKRNGYVRVDDPTLGNLVAINTKTRNISNAARKVFSENPGLAEKLARWSDANKPLDEVKRMLADDLTGNQLKSIGALYNKRITSPKKRGTPALAKTDAWVHPQYSTMIKVLTNPFSNTPAVVKQWHRFNGVIKRWIMYNPLYHGVNMWSDLMTEVLRTEAWNPFKKDLYDLPYYKELGKMKAIGPFGKIAARTPGVAAVYAPYRAKKWGGQLWETRSLLTRDAVAHGLNIQGMQGIGNDMAEFARRFEDPAEPRSWHKKGRDWLQAQLWEGLVRNAQLSSYRISYEHLLSTRKKNKNLRGLTADQLKETAAHYVNDLYGTMMPTVFGDIMTQYGNLALFARNWTISNPRLLTGAFKLGKKKGGVTGVRYKKARFGERKGQYTAKGIVKDDLLRMFRHEGLSAHQLDAASSLYRAHLVTSLINMGFIYTVGQRLLMEAMDKLKEKGIISGPRIEPTWGGVMNVINFGPKRLLDFRTGITRPDGREIFLNIPPYRYMKDLISWCISPFETAKHKFNPIPKLAIELGMNRKIAWDEEIIPEGAPILDKAKRALWQIAGSLSPASQLKPFVYDWATGKTSAIEGLLPVVAATWAKTGRQTPYEQWSATSGRWRREWLMEVLTPQEREEVRRQLNPNTGTGNLDEKYTEKWTKFLDTKGYERTKIAREAKLMIRGGHLQEAEKILRAGGFRPETIRKIMGPAKRLKRKERLERTRKKKRARRSPYINDIKEFETEVGTRRR